MSFEGKPLDMQAAMKIVTDPETGLRLKVAAVESIKTFTGMEHPRPTVEGKITRGFGRRLTGREKVRALDDLLALPRYSSMWMYYLDAAIAAYSPTGDLP